MPQSSLSIETNLADRWWRLNNLYYIIDKQGQRVLFRPKEVQRELYENLHYLNIILKSRQHGVTTFFCIMMLDYVLFNKFVKCGVIAQSLPKAQEMFRTKVEYPYRNLPAVIRANPMYQPEQSNANELLFSDSRKIAVSASFRSETLNWLHVSEYGEICADTPQKATEIQTGALESVHQGNFVSIESTARGPQGDFYDRCRAAETITKSGKPIGPMDYKFFFFPSYRDPDNVTDPKTQTINESDHAYFEGIERTDKLNLSPEYKAWYVGKKKSLKSLMQQEQPNTPQEAFHATTEGSFWAGEIRELETRNPPQITAVPHDPRYPVHTVHDPGHHWAIWFVQCPNDVYPKFIRYVEGLGNGVEHYCDLMTQYTDMYGYRYGKHVMPLDAERNNGQRMVSGNTVTELAAENGFHCEVIEKIKSSSDLIEETRIAFSTFYFDEENCKDGIHACRNFRRKKIKELSTEKEPIFSKEYLHNWASHGASALYHFVKARQLGIFDEADRMTLDRINELNANNTIRYSYGA